MDQDKTPPAAPREGIAQWLGRVNGQVSSWAASMTWWRLLLLFIIVMAAGGILSDQLHLKHDTVKVLTKKDKDVDVVIGGPDGVRITRRHKPAAPAASAAASGAEASPGPTIDISDDDDDEPVTKTVTRQSWTCRGLIGDLGSALIVIT